MIKGKYFNFEEKSYIVQDYLNKRKITIILEDFIKDNINQGKE